MGRGKVAEVGDRRISKNGYDYTKTEKQGWRLTHHMVAEEFILKRPLSDDETVRFIKGKKDLSPENIRVIKKRTSSLRKRKTQIENRIADLQNELDDIDQRLANGITD